MTNIVAVCAMYHLDEMNKMLKIAKILKQFKIMFWQSAAPLHPFRLIFLMNPCNIPSVILKSAITPSCKGLMVSNSR